MNDNRNIITAILHGNVSAPSKCKEYMNGDFDFCFSVPEDENYWFGVVLSFGNNVRVLEPQSVIDRILKNCSEVSKIYEHDN